MTAATNVTQQRCDPLTDTCRICGDEGVVGRVMAIDAAARTATVTLASGTATVALDLVDAEVGDELLVHLGFAIAHVPGEGAE